MNDDLLTRIRGMVRKGDPFTCILAAGGVERRASELHAAITEELYWNGHGMTDQELEDLPRFRPRYAYSTVRKRRTELFQAGLLVNTGKTRINPRRQTMIVWDLVGRYEPSQGNLFA